MRSSSPVLYRYLIWIVLPIIAGIITLYFHFRGSLPETTGTIEFYGLRDKVNIVRDEFGVPHIFANNDHDAYFAIGFTHAQDRFWQMELQRRLGAGRLSEALGKQSLDTDRFMRTLGVYRSAKESWELLGETSKKSLIDYTAGVNAWINKQYILPPEFALFDLKPELWSVFDSLVILKLYSLNQSGGFQKIVPDNIGKTESPSKSSIWILSGKHTKSGKPILVNNSREEVKNPTEFYLAEISGESVHVAGATLPGLPIVISGSNQDITWGSVSLDVDDQDFQQLLLNPLNLNQYKRNGKSVDMKLIRELIHVKPDFPAILRDKKPPVEWIVRTTEFGPVISDVIPEMKVNAALRWTLLEKDTTYESFYNINQAKNWIQFKAALNQYVSPFKEFAYADRQGNIGYQAAGRIPIRENDRQLRVIPADYQGDYWQGFIPQELLPGSFNPESGIIVTTADEQGEVIRSEIEALMNEKKVTPEDTIKLKAEPDTLHNQKSQLRFLFSLLDRSVPVEGTDYKMEITTGELVNAEYRQVTSFAKIPQGIFALRTGQSGNVLSKHYSDMGNNQNQVIYRDMFLDRQMRIGEILELKSIIVNNEK